MATHAQQQFHGNHDRIIPRVDKNGTPVIFLADTYDAEHITMWDGGEPTKVSVEFYHTTKPLEGAKVDKITKNYQRTYGAEVLVMQRLPRVLLDAPKLHRKEQPVDSTQFIESLTKPLPEKDATEIFLEQHGNHLEQRREGDKDVRNSETQPNVALPLQNYVMRKLGDFWKIVDSEGQSIAYAVSEDDALTMLKSLLGNVTLAH